MGSLPYIVLLGDVGTGKSTMVEKLTGVSGRSSAADESFTLTSEVYEIYDGSLIICDTPGSNAMNDKFQHNLHIAHAMNFYPVTCVLIIVKADTRMDNVVDRVRAYAEGFLPEDLPIELIGVCVTHMDTVQWTGRHLLPNLDNHLGISSAVFSTLQTPRETLRADIMREIARKRPIPMSIDSNMFLRLFKISNSNLKVMRDVRKEIGRFEKMKQDFYREKSRLSPNLQMNMTFEFQTWVHEEIIRAQKWLSERNNFTLSFGPNMENEVGHIANMTNQLRKVLSDIRVEASKYHRNVDTNFRKCPHCPAIWQKIEGCDGATNCGNRPSTATDIWSGEMSTFSFTWNTSTEQLIVRQLGARSVPSASAGNRSGYGAGCGKPITWSEMAPVEVDLQFDIPPISTNDLHSLPQAARRNWNEAYETALSGLRALKINRVKR